MVKYNYWKADEKFQDIARMLGLPASTPEEAVASYAKAVYDLGVAVGIKMNFKDQGIDEKFGWIAFTILLFLLMKTNVHQLTHVYQWLLIWKKSWLMHTMVMLTVEDALNKICLRNALTH